jgi:hypothetical protein
MFDITNEIRAMLGVDPYKSPEQLLHEMRSRLQPEEPAMPPFTRWDVSLMGERRLGIVSARWLGCILELEDGTRHGACAVYSAKPAPVPPPKRWMKIRNHGLLWPSPLEVIGIVEGHVMLSESFRMTMDQWNALDPNDIEEDSIPF